MADPITVKHLDGPSLRALAHPLRMRLLAELRNHGPATATRLGERLGESSGSTSYHLRVLAAHGFVVDDPAHPAGGGRGGQRWWKAAHDMTSWATGEFAADPGSDPDDRAAEAWLSGYLGRQAVRAIDDWVARWDRTDPAWLPVADQSDYRITMTADQARAMMDEVHAVILRHRAAAADAPPPDPGQARPVQLLVYALPQEPEAPGPAGGGT